MSEKWRAVVGYEDHYKVSDYGRVRTVFRKVVRTGGKEGIVHTVRDRILKAWPIGRCGHLYVGLYKERKQVKTLAVHRLVLEAFVGPCPDGMECRHLDGNPVNNCVDNLCWGTPKQNMADRERHGRHDRGSRSVKAKLTETDIPVIRSMKSKQWGAMSATAREYGVNAATVRDIWEGRTWQHVEENHS